MCQHAVIRGEREDRIALRTEHATNLTHRDSRITYVLQDIVRHHYIDRRGRLGNLVLAPEHEPTALSKLCAREGGREFHLSRCNFDSDDFARPQVKCITDG